MTRCAAQCALVLLACGYTAAPCAAAAGSDYPARPIRFIVPVAPGGTPDVIARVVGGELTRQMGQQVVIDNRAGANGAIGLLAAARANCTSQSETLLCADGI